MARNRKRLLAVALLVAGALAALPGGSLVLASHAPGTTVYVDDDCSDPGDGTAADPFCTVQEGVAHANVGDTVSIAAGTYAEAGQIVIDKNLTITGAGVGATVLMTDGDTGTSGDSRGWVLVNAGVVFHLSNLTMDGTGYKIWQGIRHRGSGTVANVRITNIKFNESGPSYAGTGIAAFGDGVTDVSYSTFDQVGRIGLQYFGSGVNGSTGTGNSFTGKGAGDWLDYGIEVGGGAQVTLNGNSVSGNRGVASSDGSASAGILVTTFFGAGTSALIENGSFTDNTTGIHVGFDGSDTSLVEAHQNNIAGNGSGVITTAPQVDATCNWWGDVSGPYNATTNPGGLGDSADDGVDADPWLAAPAPGGACNGPVTPSTLCVSLYTHAIRMLVPCNTAELSLTLPDQGPLTLCASYFTGAAEVSFTGACDSMERMIVAVGDNTIPACVSVPTGHVRLPYGPGQCSLYEWEVYI